MDHRAHLSPIHRRRKCGSSAQNAGGGLSPVKPLSKIAGLLLVLGSISPSLQAQAWLFPKGGGTVTLSYQNVLMRYHVDGTGKKFDFGRTITHVMSVDTDYSVTDRLAI